MKKPLTAALLALALALPAAHAAPGDNAKEPKKPAAAAKKDSGNQPAKKPATNPPAAAKEKPFAAAVKQPAAKATNDKPAADKPTRERPFGAATRTAPVAAAATAAAATAPEPQQPAAAAPAANDANALESFMRGTKDLQASFTQTVYNKRGQETSSGQMWVAKPGKFYWDYQRPNPQKIISNGKKVYHYDIDLEQISVRDRSELVGDVAVELLNGDDNISRNFQTNRTVKNLVPARLQKYAANGVAYRLKPKKHQEEYDSLWIVLDGNTISAVMIDGGSSQTVLTFSNMKRNAGIPAKQFEFTPPPGVDIVGK
ncbi:outer-membrane lipoprotein carrier protein LolA [uncultured Cardiobacterium sp.]|uniref:LolA family protein n=1 Tax=uncultured Cardiobacterium sp. TaxID=417619 RepID=UPI0026160960|nr:outer-membrane lipoprotein carrier protein LolA [uncultured Cardiobacterium sp.]